MISFKTIFLKENFIPPSLSNARVKTEMRFNARGRCTPYFPPSLKIVQKTHTFSWTLGGLNTTQTNCKQIRAIMENKGFFYQNPVFSTATAPSSLWLLSFSQLKKKKILWSKTLSIDVSPFPRRRGRIWKRFKKKKFPAIYLTGFLIIVGLLPFLDVWPPSHQRFVFNPAFAAYLNIHLHVMNKKIAKSWWKF